MAFDASPARGLSGLRAAGAISRRQSRRLSRVAQRAGRIVRRSRRAPARRRPRAGLARRQSHGAAVHRRLRRRSACTRRCSISISRAASTTGGPTTGSRCATARSSTRCVAFPRRTSRRRRKSPRAGLISPARSARLPRLETVVALGRIAHDSALRAFGLRLWRDFPSPTARAMPSKARTSPCSIAIIVRATIRTRAC